MNYKKEQDKLVEDFNKNQQVIQQHSAEINKLAVIQEQIRGKLQLLKEIQETKK